jgi:GNAT superfamily N-acetyltransferase
MKNESYKKIKVRTWHLCYGENIPEIPENCTLLHWKAPVNNEYLSLFERVGEPWGWAGRLLLTPEALVEKLNSSTNEVWLFKTEGILRGFFEIDRSEIGKAEIVYFGLLPEMIGKGFGKTFLQAAIAIASGSDHNQVWLHTCEYDHQKALELYLKSGFIIEKETIEIEYYKINFLKEKRHFG